MTNQLKSISLNVSKGLLCALFAFPLFPFAVTNLLFISFSISTIVSWILNGRPSIKKSLTRNILITLPFIPFLVEYLFFFNNSTVGFELEKKLLFLIAPIIFSFFYSVVNQADYRIYIRTFTISVTLLSIYSLTLLLIKNILFTASNYEGDSSILRIKFENISGLHPTYFGLFASVSILWILYDFKNLNKFLKWGCAISCFILILIDFLVAAKMSLIILIVGSIFVLYKTTPDKKNLLLKYLIMVASLVLLVFCVPSLRQRMYEMKGLLGTEAWVFNSVNERKLIFNASMDLFVKHIWFGVGCRNAQFAIDIYYRAINFLPGLYKNYNSHNQFLTMGINYGIFDVLLFVASILYTLWKEWKNTFAIILIFSTILIMLTESILERQMGVYFFVLFMLLLYNIKKSDSAKPLPVKG